MWSVILEHHFKFLLHHLAFLNPNCLECFRTLLGLVGSLCNGDSYLLAVCMCWRSRGLHADFLKCTMIPLLLKLLTFFFTFLWQISFHEQFDLSPFCFLLVLSGWMFSWWCAAGSGGGNDVEFTASMLLLAFLFGHTAWLLFI